MQVVVVASGELAASDAAWLGGADLVVAADGGAVSLEQIGRRPELVVGDLDSVDASLLERLDGAGTRVERHPIDKEASDTELAVEAAFAAGGSTVIVLAALGGERVDHALANLLLLADSSFAGRDLRIVRGGTTVRALHAGERLVLTGATGDLVTLLPVGGGAVGVVTEGLRWPLDAATLHLGRSRGLSNEVITTPASVRIREGSLLVIETTTKGGIT